MRACLRMSIYNRGMRYAVSFRPASQPAGPNSGKYQPTPSAPARPSVRPSVHPPAFPTRYLPMIRNSMKQEERKKDRQKEQEEKMKTKRRGESNKKIALVPV